MSKETKNRREAIAITNLYLSWCKKRPGISQRLNIHHENDTPLYRYNYFFLYRRTKICPLPVQNEKIIYRQPVYFCTGTEPGFKHTGKTFCTGKLFKKNLFAGTK
jgi:hypothetical protein